MIERDTSPVRLSRGAFAFSQVLMCLPAGASRWHYRALIPAGFPIDCWEFPPIRALAMRDESFSSGIERLLSRWGGLDPERPVVLFGHSLGGALALSLDSILKELGFDVRRILLSGLPARGERMVDADFVVNVIMTDIVATETRLPDSGVHNFRRYLHRAVSADLATTADLPVESLRGSAAQFLWGVNDELCTAKDIEWWFASFPGLTVTPYIGGHSEYGLSPKVACLYRDSIASAAAA